MLWLTCTKLQSFFANKKPSVRIPLLCFASATGGFALIWRDGVAALLRFISAVVLFGPLMGVFSKLTLLRQNWNLLYVTFSSGWPWDTLPTPIAGTVLHLQRRSGREVTLAIKTSVERKLKQKNVNWPISKSTLSFSILNCELLKYRALIFCLSASAWGQGRCFWPVSSKWAAGLSLRKTLMRDSLMLIQLLAIRSSQHPLP